MLDVALTGNVAAGKTRVADWFREWGATVIDADRLVHELQRPGTPVFEAIQERFGPGVVTAGGELDRPVLRRIVLADPDARADLERLVHPAVRARRAVLADEARARGDRILINDIPLLFETQDPDRFDAVVLVDAAPDVRRERLRQRGLTAEEADALLAAQLPADAKRARSDYVIENNGTLAALEARARDVWQALLARA